MADNDIRQKIVLEGEKEYRDALKQAQQNLKVLRSELKAETAELGKNATEQQKAEVRTKSLQKQIAEQEKIVKTYTAALKEVREKYSDNEAEIAKWEVKLNDARTALANMKAGLDDVGQGFQRAAVDANTGVTAAQSFAQAFGGLAGIGESISGAIESVFSGMADRIRSVAAEVWDLISETAARADAWGDLAGFYGSTAEEVQAMDRAITGAGADFEQFVAFMNQLEFRGKDNKLTEWLGISDEGYEDKLQFAVLAMTELSQKQKELGAAKFNEKLGEVFGGKSQGVVELIGEWDRILEKREQYKDKGYLLDEGELSVMGEVDNELKEINEKWDMIKTKIAAGLGNATLDITTNVQGSLDALARYFDAETPEERDAALADLKENILATFEALAQAIRDGIALLGEVAEELKNSEDPLVQGIGNVLGGIVEALSWFTDENANNVVKALEFIAAFWITGKGATMAAKIMQVVGNLKTIQMYNAMKGGGEAVEAAASGGGEAAGTAAKTAAGTGIAAKIGGAMASAAPWLGMAAVTAGAWFGLGEMARQRDWGEFIENEQKNAAAGIDENEFLHKLWMAAQGEDENGNDYDYEQLFRENADTFYKLSPNSDLWGKLGEWVDLADGLQTGELDDLFANKLEWGIFGEDFTDMFKDMYNILSEKLQNGDVGEIPADWWKGGGSEDGVTRQDLQAWNQLPAQVKSAVRDLIGSIRIDLDGQKVAELLVGEVSALMARYLEE